MMMQELRWRCDDNDDDNDDNDAMMMSDDDDTWYDIMYCWLVPLYASSFTSNSTSLFAYVVLYNGSKLCWLLSWDLWLPSCWGLRLDDHSGSHLLSHPNSLLFNPHRRWNSSTSFVTSLFDCWVINMNCSWLFVLQGYEARGEGQRDERWRWHIQ